MESLENEHYVPNKPYGNRKHALPFKVRVEDRSDLYTPAASACTPCTSVILGLSIPIICDVHMLA
ncbi:hypothetical protein PCCS19_13540 [Paenibacillus sp. CCS19]|nr:hypothetical protein PCCS19_13540 [Paenibacillus cellulosilyticus]